MALYLPNDFACCSVAHHHLLPLTLHVSLKANPQVDDIISLSFQEELIFVCNSPMTF